jgi:hypothetical protein
LRKITACRSARSAALFVGGTPSAWANTNKL